MSKEMNGVFSPLKGFLKFNKVCTDNNIFRLHYRVTVIILSFFTIMITTKQFFGDPIHCIGDNEDRKDAMNNYCWIFGTRTVQKHFKGVIGKHIAHLGVGPNVPGDGEIHHLYYQWVCFILPLQAALFYTPHVLWKMWESGRIKSLTEGLDSALMPTKWDEGRKRMLIKYLIDTNMYTRNYFAYQFAFCEVLNFCNVVCQIVLLDKFLGGQFAGYGAAVFQFYQNPLNPNITNPTEHVFPKVTKCLFHFYGSSGSLQSLDLLCILPLNVINQKIFAFLWFWFIFLACMSGVAVLYRLLLVMFPCLRAYIIMTQAKLVPKYHIFNIVNRFRVGDWFILHLMGKNINIFVFKDLIILLGQELEKSKKTEYMI